MDENVAIWIYLILAAIGVGFNIFQLFRKPRKERVKSSAIKEVKYLEEKEKRFVSTSIVEILICVALGLIAIWFLFEGIFAEGLLAIAFLAITIVVMETREFVLRKFKYDLDYICLVISILLVASPLLYLAFSFPFLFL